MKAMLSIASMDATRKKAAAALDRAKEAAGGPAGLAKTLDSQGVTITSQAISQWSRVPAERVLAVETATGVPRHELRPDIFPEPARAS